MTRKISKRAAYNLAILGLGLVFLTWLLATPDEPAWMALARFIVVGFLSAGSMTAGTAMLPDLMELDRRTTGVRQEGLYAAAYTLIENVGSTIGPALIGVALGLTGFIASKGGAIAEQPGSALTAITMCVSVVPGLFMVAAALLMRGYTVDRALRAVESVKTAA
jgi:Na+/melibiose symporter-like transporter